MRLKPQKCTVGVTSRILPGYVISSSGIEVDPLKIKVIWGCRHLKLKGNTRMFGVLVVYHSFHFKVNYDMCICGTLDFSNIMVDVNGIYSILYI